LPDILLQELFAVLAAVLDCIGCDETARTRKHPTHWPMGYHVSSGALADVMVTMLRCSSGKKIKKTDHKGVATKTNLSAGDIARRMSAIPLNMIEGIAEIQQARCRGLGG
jgi:hypothetical protein